MSQQVDVAIIGSGPAGSAAALALARAQHSVLLIDAANGAGWKVGEGLPPAAKPLLQRLGVWPRFLADGHLPSYGNRSLWGAAQPTDYDFIFDPNGTGWHLERQRFDAMLTEAATEAGAIKRDRTQISACQQHPDGGWQLGLKSNGEADQVKASWVIDASGRTSWFAKRQGVTRQHDDRLVGVVARFSAATPTDCDSFTLIEAAPDGWWYAALLPHQKLVVAYMSDADLVAANRLSEIAAWTDLLNQTQSIAPRIDAHHYQIDRAPRVLSANSSRLQTPIGNRWLAVGDAATGFDPLASQGIITALWTGLLAANCIQQSLQNEEALHQYADEIDQLYRRYWLDRAAYYAMEQRWRSSLFWQRRQAIRNPLQGLRSLAHA